MGTGYDLYAGDGEQAAFSLLAAVEHGHLTLWDGEAGGPATTFLHHVAHPERREILGHLSNGNPMLRRLETHPRATFTVEGPVAYIPSHWLGSLRAVPTSYYSWAQFELDVALIQDAAAIAALLAEMLERFQPEGQHPRLALHDPHWQRMTGAITGLRMRVREARSRFKYGQNRDPGVRRAIARHLRGRCLPQDDAVADFVLATLPEDERPVPTGPDVTPSPAKAGGVR
jgi:transcriptional regulator